MLLILLSSLLGVEPTTRPEAMLLYVRGAGALSCPTEAAFKESVQARLGFDPFVAAAPLRVVAQIERVAKGYGATLQLLKDGAAPRQRVLSSSSCEELSESLLLAVVLAIDPQLVSRQEKPVEPLPPAPVTPVVAEPQRVQAPLPSSPEAGTPLAFRVALAPHVRLGLSPSASLGLSIGLGFRRGPFELLAEGQADLPGFLTLPNGKVAIQPFAGFLLPCFASKIGVGACLQLGAGALRVDGQLPGGAVDVSPLVLVGARVSYEYRIFWGLELAARIGVVAVPTQVTVHVAGKPVWVTSPVAADFSIAVTGIR